MRGFLLSKISWRHQSQKNLNNPKVANGKNSHHQFLRKSIIRFSTGAYAGESIELGEIKKQESPFFRHSSSQRRMRERISVILLERSIFLQDLLQNIFYLGD